MTDKHTPGPWLIDYDCGDTHINSFDGDPIAVIEPDSVNIRANAALIARAPELLAENERLKERIAELEAKRTWRPIETAPKGVNDVVDLLANGERFTDCRWGKTKYGGTECWIQMDGSYDRDGPIDWPVYGVTHWMPLPKMEDE